MQAKEEQKKQTAKPSVNIMLAITVKTIPAVRLAITYRMLSSSIPQTIKKSKMPPRPKFTDDMEKDIEEKFLHGGRGPGGQKINKCNSKVQLRHVPTGIVVDCQATRSRDQNRKIAREKLALRLAQWENGDQPIERELAKIQWEQQSKKSKERKAKSKHREAQEQRQQQKLQQMIEEKQLLKSILEQ